MIATRIVCLGCASPDDCIAFSGDMVWSLDRMRFEAESLASVVGTCRVCDNSGTLNQEKHFRAMPFEYYEVELSPDDPGHCGKCGARTTSEELEYANDKGEPYQLHHCAHCDYSFRAVVEPEPMTPEEYVRSDGNCCPWCDARDFEASPIECYDGGASQRIECLSCHREWRDLYTLTSYEAT